jgi:serine/threonine protein kinase
MPTPSLDICWSLAEAEAAHAGFSEIGLAHFWVGACKAVELPVGKAGGSIDAANILNDSPVPIRDRMPALAKEIADVINKALVRNPKQRIQDASELLAAALLCLNRFCHPFI